MAIKRLSRLQLSSFFLQIDISAAVERIVIIQIDLNTFDHISYVPGHNHSTQ